MGHNRMPNERVLLALVATLYAGALGLALTLGVDIGAAIGSVFLLSVVGYAIGTVFVSRHGSELSFAERSRVEDEWRALGSLVGCGYVVALLVVLLVVYGVALLSIAWQTWGPR